MTENKNYTNYIFQLYDVLRETFFSKNIGFSVIRLLFLKYASDNCLGAYTREEMQNYMRVQRMLSAGDVGLGPNGLVPVLNMLDHHYNLPGLMHRSINEYARELFGLDESWVKKNTSDKNFVQIMSILSCMDLTDNLDTHEKGKHLALALIDNLQYHGENAKLASPYYSRRELGILVDRILNVNDNDVFLDFCSGIGSTTISCVGHKKCKIISYDINEESLAVASMLYIMCGYEGFEVEVRDTLGGEESDIDGEIIAPLADKIFVEAPAALKVRNHPLRDSGLISIETALRMLKDNGLAIVTVPASALFSKLGTANTFRANLLESGYLSGVISLPLTYARSTVSMYLVVLSKKQNDGVFFANLNSNNLRYILDANVKSFMRMRGANILSDDDLEKIAIAISDRVNIEGLSKTVSVNEIIEKDYDLMPSIYVNNIVVENNISIKEIDDELATLYAKLMHSNH